MRESVATIVLCLVACMAHSEPLSNTASSMFDIIPSFAINGPGLLKTHDDNVTVPIASGTTNLHLNTRVWAQARARASSRDNRR